MKSGVLTNSLWISSRTGQRYTTKNLGTLISKITLQTIGVDVSPHLFRTAAATTAAMYGGDICPISPARCLVIKIRQLPRSIIFAPPASMPRRPMRRSYGSIGTPDCGSGGRWFESTQLYHKIDKYQDITPNR